MKLPYRGIHIAMEYGRLFTVKPYSIPAGGYVLLTMDRDSPYSLSKGWGSLKKCKSYAERHRLKRRDA